MEMIAAINSVLHYPDAPMPRPIDLDMVLSESRGTRGDRSAKDKTLGFFFLLLFFSF